MRLTPEQRARYGPAAGLVCVMASCAAAYAYVFVHPFLLLVDNQAYYLLAEALLDGHGYTETWLPEPKPANHFPPGYPVLLAGWMGVVGVSVFNAKLLSGCMLLGVVGATYTLSAAVTEDRRMALVITAFVALNAVMLRYGSLVMSEMAFALPSLLALLVLLKSRGATGRVAQAGWLALTVLCLGASYYVRSIGLFLTVAIITGGVLGKRWREAGAVGIGFALLALPWFIYGRRLGGNTYSQALFAKEWHLRELGPASPLEILGRIPENAAGYLSGPMVEALMPGYALWTAGWVPAVVALMALMLIAAGFGWWTLPALRAEIGTYVACSIGILLVWGPGWVHIRFLVPLLPLMLMAAVWGGWSLLSRAAKEPLSPYLLLPLLAFSGMALKEERAWAQEPDGLNWMNARALAVQAASLLPQDAVVAARSDDQVAYLTGRKTVYLTASRDADRLMEGLAQQRATHVWIDQSSRNVYWRYVVPIIDANPQHFERIARVTGARRFERDGRVLASELYRFYPDGDAPPGGAEGR